MARVKEKLTTEEQIRENMEIDQQEYIKKLQEEGFFQAPKKDDEIPVRVAFSEYWAKHQSKFKRVPDLEEIVWLHLQAIGYDTPELFDDGLKHFGLFKE